MYIIFRIIPHIQLSSLQKICPHPSLAFDLNFTAGEKNPIPAFPQREGDSEALSLGRS
jgi:hypothetical protein